MRRARRRSRRGLARDPRVDARARRTLERERDRAVFVRARRGRSGAPRVPRRREPRLDGARRAADPRPSEGRVRRRDRRGYAQELPRSMRASRVHRRQARANRDGAGRGHGEHRQRRRRSRAEDLRRSRRTTRCSSSARARWPRPRPRRSEKRARTIRVCNRSFERAANLAQQFGGTAAPLDALEDELAHRRRRRRRARRARASS